MTENDLEGSEVNELLIEAKKEAKRQGCTVTDVLLAIIAFRLLELRS